MELKGKKTVVTGGNRGIGKAISLALVRKGAQVAVHYNQGVEKAKQTVEEIENSGGKAIQVRANLVNFERVKRMMEQVKNKLGGIDILVNNAGISGKNNTLGSIEVEEWKKVIQVNLTGAFFCCKAAWKELTENRGKIVNISSVAGKMGGTLGCHYAASKAGLIGLTFSLARELAPKVTVNAVAPGPVDTELLSPERKKILSSRIPFGRIATPQEIAHTVIYLLENDYVSGEVIDVNAGRHMD